MQGKFNQNGGLNGKNHSTFEKNTSNGGYCTYCRQPGHTKESIEP
jgi:hypothetical protein